MILFFPPKAVSASWFFCLYLSSAGDTGFQHYMGQYDDFENLGDLGLK